MSIKPEFATAIIKGDKRFEFRRTLFTQKIDVVLIYATTPIRRVVAEFKVRTIIRASPQALWKLAYGFAGIGRDRFFSYFQGKDVGYAIEIGDLRVYQTPFCPTEKFGIRPPQSFVYLDGPE